ncbi:bark storage protein A-like [Iris pallida]|uniref:Bark storage protein A-like n=1 Tax=Iris pallida TaxID=29817 RepID=A0AAX6HYQ6_IRIPA|nr:bark storage protein A-like [Iris pallida]
MAMALVFSVSVLLLAAIVQTWGLHAAHPLRMAVDGVNESGPYVGLVMAYATEAEAVQSSGEFVARTDLPWVDLYGRRFHIGSIRDVDVIYVMSGQRRLNAGITVQILLDTFDVRGIVHYGIAGSANDSLSFGDVSVPEFVAFTGSWKWQKYGSESGDPRELSFRTYNIPRDGKNLLSGVVFKTEEFYSVGKPMEEVFWLQVDPEWYRVAQNLQVELQGCVNETYCLPKTPELVCGLKASTADVFVDNAAYRKFIFEEFGASTVDEESAAIVMTALSPGVPVIVFRAVSDLAGGEAKYSSTSFNDLASINSLKVAVEFIGAIGKRKPYSSTSRI